MIQSETRNPTTADPGDAPDESRVIQARREKARRLRDQGIRLYAQKFAPSHAIAQVRARETPLMESEETVTLAGRIVLLRSFGKAGFFTFTDATGRFQAYVKKDVTTPEGFELFKSGLDVGDIVGVEGPIFTTKKGELTIRADRLTLLTKSLRPLPEKWHGLQDVEQRYRRRYVDLIVNPEVRETFRARSRIISALRRNLDDRGYMEVETPMMQSIYGGAAARPFVTHMNALDLDLYLRIAPELFLKRLIVGGYEKVYEINRNFRNEGLSTRHNPEFTMLELYTAYWDYRDTMDLTEALVKEVALEILGAATFHYQGRDIDLSKPFVREPLLSLVARALGLDPENHGLRWGMDTLAEAMEILGPALDRVETRTPQTSEAEMETAPAEDGASLRGAIEQSNSADEAIVHIFEELVEEKLIQPTFVYDYPKSLCPLTKSAPDHPALAERFEMFCCGLELANAYSEMNDPAEQLDRFEDQVRRRAAGDPEAMSEVDRDYVEALEYGMAPASGLGIGIDRLVMLLTNSPSIRDVILFPLMRPPSRPQGRK